MLGDLEKDPNLKNCPYNRRGSPEPREPGKLGKVNLLLLITTVDDIHPALPYRP